MLEKSKGFDKKVISLLICVILAICLWCYVSFVENPDMSRWVNDIPVSVTGEAKLNEKGLGIYKVQDENMSLKIKAKRNQFLDLFDSSISAVADVSSITEPGKYQIQAKEILPPSIAYASISDRRNDIVTVTVEEYVTRVFTLDTNIITHPQNGFFVHSAYIDSEESGLNISVSGCASVVDTIAYISTSEIDLGSATEDVIYPVSFVAYDFNDKIITDIDFNTQKSSINFTIFKSSVIPVTIELAGDNPNLSAECADSNLSIMGPPKSVETVTGISVRINEYNYSPGETALIALNLPEGVSLTNKTSNEVEIRFSAVVTTE